MLLTKQLLHDDELLISKLLDNPKDLDKPLACLPYVIMCDGKILDFEAAWDGLSNLAEQHGNREAAMWMAHIHTDHMPLGEDSGEMLKEMLNQNNALYQYILADYFHYERNEISHIYIKDSVRLRLFPKNLFLHKELFPKAHMPNPCDYVINKDLSFTFDKYPPATTEELYLFMREEKITGESVSYVVWEMFQEKCAELRTT